MQKYFINLLNLFFLRFLFKSIVAVSKDTGNYLKCECGLKEKKIRIINNGISLPLEIIKNDDCKRDITIGSAGRLFQVKRFDTLIEIANKVCNITSRAKFIIAGEGPERKKIENLIKYYKLERQVKLLGYVEDMKEFYNKIDLYVNTSIHEGTPMSILESMGYGIPTIVFSVAGLKEMINNGVDGIFIPEGDNDLFALKIVESIENFKKVKELGKRARKKIEDRFSTKRMAEEYTKLYFDVAI